MSREEWRRSRQGKKATDSRCGRTIEATPVCGQTCQIEAAVAAPDEDRIEKDVENGGHRLISPSA
ncbi:hypothetical protein BJF92_08760 [Rhizobium rhizosphaerae]|uniref:Uncharacterized protein n=1 Tax=Xaviernesmea rhizosphaerae TaxID=1672749 RepID=A0A1Q9AHD0_9HYPH|nr:hypothetical protein [Xaviernesmea rhizosphaerae]OLP54635.1 hypothetical protein BJF92_08760 [Xaviernesmea rhizosphaerae]